MSSQYSSDCAVANYWPSVFWAQHKTRMKASIKYIVWQRCSKTDFTSLNTVQLSLNLAILSCNRGAKSFVSLAERMGLKPGLGCATYFHKCDVLRIDRAEKRQSVVDGKRRQEERRRKATAEKRLLEAEGAIHTKQGHFESLVVV